MTNTRTTEGVRKYRRRADCYFDAECNAIDIHVEDLEAENAELKKDLAAIIEITHNNYDHDTQRIYKIAKEASNDM